MTVNLEAEEVSSELLLLLLLLFVDWVGLAAVPVDLVLVLEELGPEAEAEDDIELDWEATALAREAIPLLGEEAGEQLEEAGRE